MGESSAPEGFMDSGIIKAKLEELDAKLSLIIGKAKLEALDAKLSLILAHLEAWDARKELKP